MAAEIVVPGRAYALAPGPEGEPAGATGATAATATGAGGAATAATAATPAPRRLVVVYDETCELCRRAGAWLATQPTFVPLELLAAGSAEAHERYGSLPWLGEELVVVDELGHAWIGPAAFVVALWSTRRYRHWSYRLSGPAFAPLAEQFFHRLSASRRRVGAVLVRSHRRIPAVRPLPPPAPPHERGDGSSCPRCSTPGVRS